MRSVALAALSAALVAGVALPAQAGEEEDTEAARSLFIEASRLADQGRFTEARVTFRASLRLRKSAMTLYSLGVVDRELGLTTEALENFRAFLAEPSTAATSRYEDPARKAIAEIEHPRAKRGPTAEEAAAPPAATTPSRVVPITLMAGGAALIAAGVITGLDAVVQASGAPTATGPEASSARTKALVGDVLAGVGLATAVAGAVVLLVQKTPQPTSGAVSMTPWIGAASAGLTMRF